MLRKLCILLLTACIGASSLLAAPRKASSKAEINSPSTSSQPTFHTLDDHIGTVYTAGRTYCNCFTTGRMIAVDAFGMVSVAWTNCSAPTGPRYVYINLWDPGAEAFYYDSLGIRMDGAVSAGCVTQASSHDNFFFAFHQLLTGSRAHTAVAVGALVSEPDWCYEAGTDLEILWPRIGADANAILHLISTENPTGGNPGDPYRIFYSRGVPEFDASGFVIDIHWSLMSCGGYEFWDSVMVISADVACSRHSGRCAIAWCRSMDDLENNPTQINNEIYLRVSEDGGLNWGEPVNVTEWTPWDPDCYHSGGDPLVCDRDTFRCYTDLSVLLDEDDDIHIAFTTIGFWWYLPDQSDSGFVDPTRSMIFHWSEETGYYSLAADGWYWADEAEPYQHNVQCPSLAIDPQTRSLYCSYQRYDTTVYPPEDLRMADAFVTVSTDGGAHWAVGTNVTDTTPDSLVPGEGMHEQDITVAPVVTDGFLHMEYLLNRSGGSPSPTLNPVVYQRIPIDQIPTSPLLPNYPMHYDSAGHPPESHARGIAGGLPQRFRLHQNYPNPFNATTMIQFDLTQRATVTLRIYNILGQQVTALLDRTPLAQGAHKLAFDASSYPSGVYICQLTAPDFSAARKMLLLK